MLRKALTLGMVFILALSLLAVSMITCFTYDADADIQLHCTVVDVKIVDGKIIVTLECTPMEHHHTG